MQLASILQLNFAVLGNFVMQDTDRITDDVTRRRLGSEDIRGLTKAD